MTRKYGAILLIAVSFTEFGVKSAIGQSGQNSHDQRVQSEADRLMSGKRSKVVVVLVDGTRRKGHIVLIRENNFDLADSSDRISTIDYSDVDRIKKDKRSKGAKTAIWIGVAAGVVVLTLIANRPGFGKICPLGCRTF